MGTVGASYDNALAESVIGLLRMEVIRRRGPWRGLENVERAVLEWVAWFNTKRLLEPLGHRSPFNFDLAYHQQQAGTGRLTALA